MVARRKHSRIDDEFVQDYALYFRGRNGKLKTNKQYKLKAYERFVPNLLAVAMMWIIDKNAFESGDANYPLSNGNKRKYFIYL